MNMDITYIPLVLVIILMSMTLHEAMHAFAGYWLGDDTAKAEGRLTLNPLAHIDPFLTIGLPLLLVITSIITHTLLPIFGGAKPVPFNPERVRFGEFGAALVGLAGPLTNFVLAFIFFAAYVLAGMPGGIVGDALQLSILVNLGFFIFNMIPLPPLDGSRVLYAIAPDGVRSFMEMIEQNGLIVVFVVVMLAGQYLGQFISTTQNVILSAFGALFGVRVI